MKELKLYVAAIVLTLAPQISQAAPVKMLCFELLSSLGASFSFFAAPKIEIPVEAIPEAPHYVSQRFVDVLKDDYNGDVTVDPAVKMLETIVREPGIEIPDGDLEEIMKLRGFTVEQRMAVLHAKAEGPADSYDYGHGLVPRDTPHVEGMPRGIFETIRALAEASNPAVIYSQLIETLQGTSVPLPWRQTILGAAHKVGEIIFNSTPDSYNQGEITGPNAGIVNYLRRQLETDPVMLGDALKFYHRLSLVSEGASYKPQVWDKTDFDVWKLALDSCDNDALRALRALAVFGQDEAMNELPDIPGSPYNGYIHVLNQWRPIMRSLIFYPESLPQSKIPAKFVKRFKGFLNEYREMFEPVKADEAFRAGHYHFIAGAMMATELIRAGYGKLPGSGIRLPVFIAQNLGFFYKLVVMQNRYLSEDGKELMKRGYNSVGARVRKPKEWDEKRFKLAKLAVDMELTFVELTAYQHGKGAEWAYGVLKDYSKK